MSKFQAGSGGQIYDPIIVEINGKPYTARKLTRNLIRAIEGIKSDSPDPSWSSVHVVYQQLGFMLGSEAQEDIDNLDIREASDLLVFITNQYAQKKEADKPADKPAAVIPVGVEAQGDQGKN